MSALTFLIFKFNTLQQKNRQTESAEAMMLWQWWVEFTPHYHDNRELKQTTTTTATRTSSNKRFHEQTMTVHVRYKPLYISLPSAAKQQREMTKFGVVYGTWTTTANSW